MQIVIDIDENIFTRLFDNGTEDYEIANDDLFAIVKSIRKGIPLPEGHGDLKDADKLKNAFIKWSMVVRGSFTDSDIAAIVYNSPTIIKADEKREG